MSEQTLRLVDRLQERLRSTVRRITLADLAFGLIVTLGVAATAWLVSAALEAGFWLSPTPRSVVAGALLLLIGTLTAVYVGRPLLRLLGLLPRLSDEAAAQRIGIHYPNVADRLVNMLQLASGRRSDAPEPLVDRAVARLGEEVEPVPFEEVEDFERARRASRLAVLPFLGLLVFLVAAPNAFLGASERLLAPGTHFQRPAPFHLAVTPGAIELVKGDSLQIRVRADGSALPDALTLQLRHRGEERVEDIQLSPDSAGVFHHTLRSVRASLQYRAQAGRVETAWHEVSVVERPLVRRLQITLEPPSYTGLSPERLEPNVGDVAALAGTRVRLEAQLGGPPIEEAFVVFSSGARDTLSVEGPQASGAFTLRQAGHYQIQLESAEGTSNQDPIRYTLEVHEDAAPTIAMLAPDPETTLGEDLRTLLRFRIGDDFGFSGVQLHHRLAERRLGEAMDTFEAIDLPLEAPERTSQDVRYDWLLSRSTDLDPIPGDVIEYYVEVWDNNRFAGYQSARTATQRLRVPSLAEKYQQLDREQRVVEDQMEELLNQEQTVKEQFESLQEELRRKQDADWEDERQLERLQEQQQALEEGVEELSRQIESASEQMRESNLVSEETQQLYQELQQVSREINSPELQQALEELQEALQNMNLEQMQQALEDFSFNEEQYRQRLERTLDLFKQLRVQQKLDEASRRAEAMSRQQEQLAQETQKLREEESGPQGENAPEGQEAPQSKEAPEGEANQDNTAQDSTQAQPERAQEQTGGEPSETTSPEERSGAQEQAGSEQPSQQASGQGADSSSAAEQQEALARAQELAREEMQDLQQQLDSLATQMNDVQRAPKQEMQALSEEVKQQQLPQRMQENSEQLRQNQLQQAQQGQQEMQQQLQEMQQQLQGMQQGMQGQQQQMNAAGLKQALNNTLRLSQQQEALNRETRDLSSDSPKLRENAQRQQRLAEGLRTVSDSLQQLARNVPQMSRAVQRQTGRALREMRAATEAMSERSAEETASRQNASMTELNRLALSLSDLLDQVMNGQGQGGGMSAQQMAQQLQQMAQQQGGLNEQVQQFLNDMQGNRLSADQAERLQQMASQQQSIREQLDELRRQEGVEEQALGDLGRVAEQMEETIRELQQRRADRRTVERQQQILSRLLDAQRSLRQQGEDENRREAQRAEGDYTRESPGELSPQEQADRLRRALLRAMESGYTPDYEALIKRYFELLEQQEEQEQPEP